LYDIHSISIFWLFLELERWKIHLIIKDFCQTQSSIVPLGSLMVKILFYPKAKNCEIFVKMGQIA